MSGFFGSKRALNAGLLTSIGSPGFFGISKAGATLLLAHFDTSFGGIPDTPDSSIYGNTIHLNAGLGELLTASNPKFGLQSLASNGTNFFSNYCCHVPWVPTPATSNLNIFTSTEWTIEGWFMSTVSTANGPLTLCAYGDSSNGNPCSAFQILINPAGDGLTAASYQMGDQGNWGTGLTVSSVGGLSFVTNVWNHLAVVGHAGSINMYLNGIFILTGNAAWIPANYVRSGVNTIDIGGFSRASGATQPCQIDEFRVSNIARYTGNFTPPTAPFDPSS